MAHNRVAAYYAGRRISRTWRSKCDLLEHMRQHMPLELERGEIVIVTIWEGSTNGKRRGRREGEGPAQAGC